MKKKHATGQIWFKTISEEEYNLYRLNHKSKTINFETHKEVILPEGAVKIIPHIFMRVNFESEFQLLFEFSTSSDMKEADVYLHNEDIHREPFKKEDIVTDVIALYFVDNIESLCDIGFSENVASIIMDYFHYRVNLYDTNRDLSNEDDRDEFVEEFKYNLGGEDILFSDFFEYDMSVNLLRVNMNFILICDCKQKIYIMTYVSAPSITAKEHYSEEEHQVSDFLDNLIYSNLSKQFEPNNFR